MMLTVEMRFEFFESDQMWYAVRGSKHQTCSEGQAGVCNEESKVGRMAAGCYFDSHGTARVVSFVQVVPTPRGRDNPVSTAQSISDFRDLCGTFGTRY